MTILKNIKLDIPDDMGKEFLKRLMGGRRNPHIEKLLEEKRDACIKNITPETIFLTLCLVKFSKGNKTYLRYSYLKG